MWARNLELLKENLIQFVIKILTRVDEDMVGRRRKLGDDPRELDDLWSRSYDGQDFEPMWHETISEGSKAEDDRKMNFVRLVVAWRD
jgi:hypothetical protein